MKDLRKQMYFLPLLILFAFALSNCNKNTPCEDNCQNGYCSDGDCVCDSGFGGKWCVDNIGNNTNNSNEDNSGTVSFWRDFSGNPIRISVDSIYRGQITEVFNTDPQCNNNGTLDVELNYGTYYYSAIEDSTGITWSNTFTISVPCVTYKLTL
ncbi:MAG: hypothetical protein WD048_07660 [Chitinophagales bacterium]